MDWEHDESGDQICTLVYYPEDPSSTLSEGGIKRRGRKPKVKPSDKTFGRAVPLKASSLIVDIHQTLAEVKLRHFYSSERNWAYPTNVFLMVSKELDGYTLCYFKAKIYTFKEGLGRSITAEIQMTVKTMEQAQGEYCNAIKKGDTIDRRESEDSNSNYLKLRIGALKPTEFVEVTMHFVTELRPVEFVSVGTFRLFVPAFLTMGRLPNSFEKMKPKPFSGQIVIRSGSKILDIYSPTHQKVLKRRSSLLTGNSSKKLLIAEFSDFNAMNEDFILEVKMASPSELFTYTEEAVVNGMRCTAVMAHLIPIQEDVTHDTELIIAVNSGAKYSKQLEFTLMMLVSLLPLNCYINIVSDIDDILFAYPSSRRVADTRVLQELKFFISRLMKNVIESKYDMLRPPRAADALTRSFRVTPIRSTPKRIIVVHNVEQNLFDSREQGTLIELSRPESRPIDSMIFSISVGARTSTTLERVAKYGGGIHAHISAENEESKIKIRNLVVEATKYDIKGVKLLWKNKMGFQIQKPSYQTPGEITSITNGMPITLFAMFEENEEKPWALEIFIKSPGKYQTCYLKELRRSEQILAVKPGIIHRHLASLMAKTHPDIALKIAVGLEAVVKNSCIVGTDAYGLPKYSTWILGKNSDTQSTSNVTRDTAFSNVLCKNMGNRFNGLNESTENSESTSERNRYPFNFEMKDASRFQIELKENKVQNVQGDSDRERSIEIPIDKNTVDYFSKLQKLQLRDGSFSSLTELSKWVGCSFKNIMTKNGCNAAVWGTCVVLSILAEKYNHFKVLWEPIAYKAEGFLRAKLCEVSNPFMINAARSEAIILAKTFVTTKNQDT